MEAERKRAEQIEDTFTYSEEESNEKNRVPGPLATSGVFFQCPMIGKCSFCLCTSIEKNYIVKNGRINVI